ncbi:M14 family metallopeptidase [Catalinimonas niigatensis]|uniref:M14 family metallopeptidase n=1 Tax=Catalinimonas niigatensis TaxID=1397264 RepID=UPI002666EDEA|nr:M14 family metallopeptidase [Catalinimonas niigatensis]WPP48596.1 M14 family metallopeptidase [Catalinimonas niigatensis]
MKKIYTLLAILFTVSSLFAQIPTPAEFLGYELGERFTPHYRVIDYFELIAEEVPNISLTQYGETNEYRPLVLAFISSPENFDQLENIRKANLKRAGLLEASENGFEDIAIVWLSYNVHGNESVSTEASMQVLYDLANKNNTQAQEWLKNTVVMIDPCINPDGRERYVNWYQQKVGAPNNPSPDAWEHNEPWPGGRANHYLFDLNRDWAWLTQKESRKRLEIYNQWLPHVHADFHEQGVNSPYYFAPAAEPYHKLITDWQRDLQTQIGENNARYFDEEGWLYFTRERFDLLYPSYGDTYPTYNGAIGMTYEQGGSGRAGLAVLTEEGDTLTLTDRIAHHVTTSLSTIEVSSKNASRVVEEFDNFFVQAVNNPTGKYKSFVIKKSDNEDKWQALQKLLNTHEIEYSISNISRNVSGFNYQNSSNESFRMESGDMILSAYQPKSVLLQVLFEPEAELSDSITYDITAWSIPYAYDLQAYALSARVSDGQAPEQSEFEPVAVQDNAYAYVAPWKSVEDVKFLSKVIQAGVRARYAGNEFTINGQRFPAGSIIMTRANNEDMDEVFDETVVEIANELKQNVLAVTTGFVGSGYDLGSGEVHYIEPPKVLLIGGEGTSSLAFGEIWYFFEQDIEYPVTVVDSKDINDVDLSDYNTLILPDGRYDDMLSDLDLEAWISQGGKVIALEDALEYFEGKEGYSLSEYSSEQEKQRIESRQDVVAESNRLASYGQRERRDISNYISGGIFKLQLDNTHPLALGYPSYYYTLKRGSKRYGYLENDWNVGTIRDQNALVSGFAGSEILKKLPESLVFGVEGKGNGELVYMVDNPLFRAFWYNGKLMFGNALFLVGQN